MSVIVGTAEIEPLKEKIITSLNRTLKPDSVTIDDGLALIAVVGRGMVKAKGTAARVFSAVSNAGVNIRMIDQGSSELNIILGVEERDFEVCVKAIYDEFVND
jgi:aspartate kinase